MPFKKKIVLTNKQKKDLARLSGLAFARKYRIKAPTVYHLRVICGVTKLLGNYKAFEDKTSEAYKDLQVLSASQLAMKYHVVSSMVYRIRKRFGIKRLRASELYEKLVTPKLLSDLEKLPVADIVTKYKIPVSRVFRLKNKYGLKQISFFDSLTEREKKDLISMDTEKAALKFGVSTRTIIRAKKKLTEKCMLHDNKVYKF